MCSAYLRSQWERVFQTPSHVAFEIASSWCNVQKDRTGKETFSEQCWVWIWIRSVWITHTSSNCNTIVCSFILTLLFWRENLLWQGTVIQRAGQWPFYLSNMVQLQSYSKWGKNKSAIVVKGSRSIYGVMSGQMSLLPPHCTWETMHEAEASSVQEVHSPETPD